MKEKPLPINDTATTFNDFDVFDGVMEFTINDVIVRYFLMRLFTIRKYHISHCPLLLLHTLHLFCTQQ